MTLVESAIMLAAVAFAVFVGFLVPVLIRLRTTISEAGQLLATVRDGLPVLMSEIGAMVRNVNALTEQARGGVARAADVLHAAGEVGESLQAAHERVRDASRSMMSYVTGIVAGGRAAMQVLRRRRQREGPLSQSDVPLGESNQFPAVGATAPEEAQM